MLCKMADTVPAVTLSWRAISLFSYPAYLRLYISVWRGVSRARCRGGGCSSATNLANEGIGLATAIAMHHDAARQVELDIPPTT